MRAVCEVIAAALIFGGSGAAAEDFVKAVEKITPSLATVISKAGAEGRGQLCSVTTGVVASADGLILTAYHATAGFDNIAARLCDGQTYAAVVHGFDAVSGLALLKIDAVGLTPVEFADSDKLRVGQWVLSAGNQFGIERSSSPGFSVGIIGRLNCSVPYADAHHRDLIRTDAAMNPGCVGGPLIDTHGRAVGINIAICSSTGTWQGVGYAIPSNVVVRLMQSLKTGEKNERGWLGVNIVDDGAVRISSVAKDTPAERTGLHAGDTIVAYNGKSVGGAHELVDLVAASPPGSIATITIVRDDKKQDMTVKLGSRPVGLPGGPSPISKVLDPPAEPSSEKAVPRFPAEIADKLGDAGSSLQEAIEKYLAQIKDTEFATQWKEAIDQLAGIELRVISPDELKQLHEENAGLKKRVEQLEKLLNNK